MIFRFAANHAVLGMTELFERVYAALEALLHPEAHASSDGSLSESDGSLVLVIAEEVPGLFVFGVFGFGAGGGQEDFVLAVGGGEGDDVPDGDGDQVGGDEVELGEAVGDSVGVDVALEGGAALAAGGLDLDAEENWRLCVFSG
jgi:hypothetical protein